MDPEEDFIKISVCIGCHFYTIVYVPPFPYSFDMHSIIPLEENPHLYEVSRRLTLEEIRSPRVQELIHEMKTLLAKEKHGVALAATQVGEPLRLFVVSGAAIAKRKEGQAEQPAPDQVYINPVLTKLSKGRKEKHEGCLSLRGYWGEVPRAEKATIKAFDENGTEFTRGASGLLAHIFQHEMDHLEGIMYSEKATHLYEENEEDDE